MPSKLLDDLIPDKIVLIPYPPFFEVKNGITTKVIKRLNAIKEVTGQSPEYIIHVPEGVAAASKKRADHLADVRNVGFKAEYVELGSTFDDFERAARGIYEEARTGGK